MREKKDIKGNKMIKKVLIPLAQGFEELEFIGISDVLKRASVLSDNLEIYISSLNKELIVSGAHGIQIKADFILDDIEDKEFDAIALAGGFEGMSNLKANATILNIIKKLNSNGKIIGAICASPIVLNEARVLKGEFTCYPGCEKMLNGVWVNKAVCVNKNIITSAGPATAVLFGLELVKALCGEEIYEVLYKAMLVPLLKSIN